MISFSCTYCQSPLKAEPKGSGQKVKCPRCLKVVTVPEKVSVGSGTDPVPYDEPRSESSVPGIDETMGGLSAAPEEVAALLAPPRGSGEIGWLGPYRVLKVLGHGGMGVVFHAEDPALHRPVAIKAILPRYAANPHARQRFIREARAAAGLKHDHIVAIYQVGEDRGVPYQAMEYLEGQSLDHYLKRKQQLPVTEALRIARDIANGLAEAHAHNLVHRDIKPGNIWLEKKKETAAGLAAVRVKILDFGLARDGKEDTSLTQHGTIIGTPSYMAPEQAKGEVVDYRSDLFSLGCLLYRMSTGRLPFKGPNTMAILAALALETPIPPRELCGDIPTSVSDFILRLLEKEPERRPASAKETAESLQRLLKEAKRTTKVDVDPTVQSAALAPTPRQRRFRVWLAGLVLATVFAAGVWFFLFRPRSEVKTADNPPPPVVENKKKDPPKEQPKIVERPFDPDPFFKKLQLEKIPSDDLEWAFGKGAKPPNSIVGLVRNRSTGGDGRLNGFAISGDGHWLALGGPGFKVEVYDFFGDSSRLEPPSPSPTIGYALSDNTLTVAYANGGIVRRSLFKQDDRQAVADAPLGVNATAFSVPGGFYLVGTDNGYVHAIFAGDNKKKSTVLHPGHDTPIKAVMYRHQRLVTVDEAGGVIATPLFPKSTEQAPIFPEPGKPYRHATLGPPNQHTVLVSFARSQLIHIVDFGERRVDARKGEKHESPQIRQFKTGGDVASFALSPEGNILATISPTGWIQFWNFAEQRKIGETFIPPPANVQPGEMYGPMQYSPHGRHLLIGHPRGAVVIVRLPSNVVEPPPAPKAS